MPGGFTAGILGRNGATTASMKALVDADLAAMTAPSLVWLRHILVNIGANDIGGAMPTEAGFKADLGYILDAFHIKWPNATVYVASPWERGATANANTLAGWIAAVVAARSSWAFAGPDERTWLENGDDGATYTIDGIHYSSAGNTAAQQQWMTAMGY